MFTPRTLIPVALAASLLVACGQAKSDTPAAPAAPATTAAATATDAAATTTTTAPVVAAAPAAAVVVKAGNSDLGKILVGADGLTMYGFTNDADAKSTCIGTCAEQWPPVLVDPSFAVGPGLDVGVFATTTRDDGTTQLVSGKSPLYFFSGDITTGDVNGQGSGGVWFAAGIDGGLITDGADPAPADTAPAPAATEVAATEVAAVAAAPSIQLADSDLGRVLVDANGLTLYLFTKDGDGGVPTCAGGCATAWPPALLSDAPVVGDGIDPALVTTVDTPEGKQLKIGKWPLYRFAGDAAAGEINGQASGGVWFVVGADAKSIK